MHRTTFTREEIDSARAALDAELTEVRQAGDDTVLVNALAVALDRRFVHRARAVTGRGASALNELEVIVDGLILNGGVVRGVDGVDYEPNRSVLGLQLGDEIALSARDLERLAGEVFEELDEKFADSGD